MEPLAALVVATGILGIAVAVGLILRARSGRRRTAKVGDVEPAEVGLEVFGSAATIVQFSTEYCARCPGVKRALTALADEQPGVTYTDVDLTHNTELASRFRVLQTPTVLVFDGAGSVTARFGGAVTASAIRDEINNVKELSDVAVS